MIVFSLDDVIKDPDAYVDDILGRGFADVPDGDKVFKGIQPRPHDELQSFVMTMFPDYVTTYNFVRQSSLHQVEPNFIHTDEMMGDKTVVLYLNKTFPKQAGTTLYKGETPVCTLYAEYNRMIVFDSRIPHSRNIFENFGEGENSRLAQVMFIKKV